MGTTISSRKKRCKDSTKISKRCSHKDQCKILIQGVIRRHKINLRQFRKIVIERPI